MPVNKVHHQIWHKTQWSSDSQTRQSNQNSVLLRYMSYTCYYVGIIVPTRKYFWIIGHLTYYHSQNFKISWVRANHKDITCCWYYIANLTLILFRVVFYPFSEEKEDADKFDETREITVNGKEKTKDRICLKISRARDVVKLK